MGLLEEIQGSVIHEGTDISPILLKLRLLAARLGSVPLEEWVKHESEGYSANVAMPNYRVVPVSYTGSFSGPFGSGIRNAPIPNYLVKKFAGDRWERYEMRQSISAVDDLVKSSANGGSLAINASNLILLLQGRVYEDYACNSVVGSVSRAALVSIQHAVRNRVLELTIQLELVAGAREITLGTRASAIAIDSQKVTHIAHQTVYGNVTTISSSGAEATFNIAVRQGNESSFVDALVEAGVPKSDASELATIIASEKPESQQEPFGTKAKVWVVQNLKKAVDGTWKIGVSVASELLKEATLKYYGLK